MAAERQVLLVLEVGTSSSATVVLTSDEALRLERMLGVARTRGKVGATRTMRVPGAVRVHVTALEQMAMDVGS